MSTSPLIAFQEVASRRRMVVAEIPPIEETIVRAEDRDRLPHLRTLPQLRSVRGNAYPSRHAIFARACVTGTWLKLRPSAT